MRTSEQIAPVFVWNLASRLLDELCLGKSWGPPRTLQSENERHVLNISMRIRSAGCKTEQAN